MFLPSMQEAIRDKEVAVTFLKKCWVQTVEGRFANSPAPPRLRNCTLEIGVSSRKWEPMFYGRAPALMAKVNWFMSRRRAQRLDFQVVDPRSGDFFS